MLLPVYLGLMAESESALAESFRAVASGHAAEADVFHLAGTLAKQCDAHSEALAPIIERYGASEVTEPQRLHATALAETRPGALGLLRDLHDLFLLASFVNLGWTILQQAGQALRDDELLKAVSTCARQTEQQLEWLNTRVKEAAPQTLVVAS